jgi:hypothetical protein
MLALSLLVFWPGVAMYDTVQQYQQALAGKYDDWHPPMMAALWSLLLRFGSGTGPMLLVQMASYWLGLGALALGLGGRRALAVLAIGAFPIFLGWQAVVLKDTQLVGALACATGLVAYYRLRDRPLPALVLAAAILCIAYATLMRANAAFSTVPLAVLLFAPATLRPSVRAAIAILGIPVAIIASQAFGHVVLGAQSSGVQRSEAIFDLSGIAVRTGDAAATGFTPEGIEGLRAGRCVKPLFWDPLTDHDPCKAATDVFSRYGPGALYQQLAIAVLRHPVAYAAHRLAHLNATTRWLVPFRWPLAIPPAKAEPNDLGLISPRSPAVHWWQILTRGLLETPFGWPIFWIVLGLWGLCVAYRRTPGTREALATALLVSALAQEASFAVLSISSDLRYHLWAMLATALAWVLIWERPLAGRRFWIALAVLAFVIGTGLTARIILPVPPQTYKAMLL